MSLHKIHSIAYRCRGSARPRDFVVRLQLFRQDIYSSSLRAYMDFVPWNYGSLTVLQIQIFIGKWFVRSAYTIMFVSISYGIAVLMEAVVLCRPIAYAWDKSIEGTCGNATKAYEAVGILNLFIDIAIIILPMPSLWRLQLPFAKKVGLTAIFGIGFMYVSIKPYPAPN